MGDAGQELAEGRAKAPGDNLCPTRGNAQKTRHSRDRAESKQQDFEGRFYRSVLVAMLKGYRVFTPLVGLAVAFLGVFALGLWAGEADSHYGEPQTYAYEDGYTDPEPNGAILGAPSASGRRSYEDVCQQPESHDDADLCQQWRSANAARDAARFAAWQLALSTLGIMGLGATLYFSLSANEAATRSAVAAEKAYVAERRPWLQLRLLNVLEVRVDRDKSASVIASFEVSCLSQNPADNVMVSFKAFKLSGPPPVRSQVITIASAAESQTVMEEFAAMVVVPDRPERVDRWANVVWQKQDVGTGKTAFRIGIVAIATYRAIGDDKTYHTAETYVVRRMVDVSDSSRGFFFESEPHTYRSNRIEFSSPPAGRHAT